MKDGKSFRLMRVNRKWREIEDSDDGDMLADVMVSILLVAVAASIVVTLIATASLSRSQEQLKLDMHNLAEQHLIPASQHDCVMVSTMPPPSPSGWEAARNECFAIYDRSPANAEGRGGEWGDWVENDGFNGVEVRFRDYYAYRGATDCTVDPAVGVPIPVREVEVRVAGLTSDPNIVRRTRWGPSLSVEAVWTSTAASDLFAPSGAIADIREAPSWEWWSDPFARALASTNPNFEGHGAASFLEQGSNEYCAILVWTKPGVLLPSDRTSNPELRSALSFPRGGCHRSEVGGFDRSGPCT